MINWTKEGKEHVLSQILSGITYRYTFEQRLYTSNQLLRPYEVRKLTIRENKLTEYLARIEHVYDRYHQLDIYLTDDPKMTLLASIRGEHIND